jgi:hypothetical protein
VVLISSRKPLPKLARKAYELYFGCKVGNKERFWCRELVAAHVQGLWQAMDKDSKEFNYSGQKFPKISETKSKEGILLVYKLNNYSKTTILIQN